MSGLNIPTPEWLIGTIWRNDQNNKEYLVVASGWQAEYWRADPLGTVSEAVLFVKLRLTVNYKTPVYYRTYAQLSNAYTLVRRISLDLKTSSARKW